MSAIIVSAIAGADLSSSQYLIVKVDGSDSERLKVATAADGADNFGILQNKPADEGVAHVAVGGVCKAIALGAIEPFDYLMWGTGGKVTVYTPSTTNICIGRYIPAVKETIGSSGLTRSYKDAAAGDIIDVLLGVKPPVA